MCIRQANRSVAVYTQQGIHEPLSARTLASPGRPSAAFFLSLLYSSVLVFPLTLASSRRSRCIPRGSPLDIVAPRRLVSSIPFLGLFLLVTYFFLLHKLDRSVLPFEYSSIVREGCAHTCIPTPSLYLSLSCALNVSLAFLLAP